MAKVIVGSARSDENKNARGGKAGDQNGWEVSTQNWYLHSKGWVVIRAKRDDVRAKIAEGMFAACENANIGYDQGERLTLYNNVKDKGFNPALCDKPVETDCSALARVCALYGFRSCGIETDIPNFRTNTQPDVLAKTGEFEVLTDAKYTKQQDYLMKGDILCTKTQGHTVVAITDGDKAEYAPMETPESETGEIPATEEKTAENGAYTVTGGSVYLWNGHPKHGGAKAEIVRKGETLGEVDGGGYIAVDYKGETRWVNSVYVRR